MNSRLLLAVLIVALVIGISFFIRINQSNFKVGDLPGNTQNSLNDNSKNLINIRNDDEDDNEDEGDDDRTTTLSTTSSTKPQTGKSILLSELSNHDSKLDCWVAYDGKVYDITSFLPKHPGSSARIEPYCGTADEFKQAFEKQHGKSKVSNLMRMGVLMGDFDVMGNV